MPPHVACWFDYSSPFAYLGCRRVEGVAREVGAEVRFEPFLLGALFKTIGTPLVPLHSFGEQKARHFRMDLHRQADLHGVPFRFTSHFPLNTVSALRFTLAAPAAARPRVVHRLMRAAWAEDEDLANPTVLERCAIDLGLEDAFERLAEPEVKAQLRAQTERAHALGFPGAPCFVVDEHVYWGQDRLGLVAEALRGTPPSEGP